MQIYSTPTFEQVATVRELTLGGVSGGKLDADFRAGTPFGSLTFSA